MIEPSKLLNGIIRPACASLSNFLEIPMINTPSAHALLLRIAAVESSLRFRRQHHDGPGTSWWQIEPLTAASLMARAWDDPVWSNWAEVFDPERTGPIAKRHNGEQSELARTRILVRLAFDPIFACQLARAKLWFAPEPLPPPEDVDGQARYWKRWYNTPLGKGTVEAFKQARAELLASVEKANGWWSG